MIFVNYTAQKGTSVLHEAINRNLKDIIQLLLQTGADVDIPDCVNKDFICSISYDTKCIWYDTYKQDGESPLHMVISQAAQLTDVARILVQKGASVNTKNSVTKFPRAACFWFM